MKSSGAKVEDKNPPARRRGRPARLSRDQILQTALELLKNCEAHELTLSAIARELGTHPMSLYTHVDGIADVIEGASRRVFSDIQLEIADADDWRVMLGSWLDALYHHLKEHPHIIKVANLNNQISAGWIGSQVPIVRRLSEAGLQGKTLAMANSWIAEVCMGMVNIQVVASIEDQYVDEHYVDTLPEEDRKQVMAIMTALQDVSAEEYFEFMKDRILASVASLFEPQGV